MVIFSFLKCWENSRFQSSLIWYTAYFLCWHLCRSFTCPIYKYPILGRRTAINAPINYSLLLGRALPAHSRAAAAVRWIWEQTAPSIIWRRSLRLSWTGRIFATNIERPNTRFFFSPNNFLSLSFHLHFSYTLLLLRSLLCHFCSSFSLWMN